MTERGFLPPGPNEVEWLGVPAFRGPAKAIPTSQLPKFIQIDAVADGQKYGPASVGYPQLKSVVSRLQDAAVSGYAMAPKGELVQLFIRSTGVLPGGGIGLNLQFFNGVVKKDVASWAIGELFPLWVIPGAPVSLYPV